MAVKYSNAKMSGVVKHGQASAPQSEAIIMGTYEEGMSIEETLAGYFADEYGDYEVIGSSGSLTFDSTFASVSGVAGAIGIYTFTVRAFNEGGPSETLTFEYEVVPLHGLEADYTIAPDGQTASFTPYFADFNVEPPVLTTTTMIGFTTNIDQSTYVSEQLVTENRPAEDYIWSGSLGDTDLTITSTGLVEGTIAIGDANDGTYGPFELTVTSPFGDEATLTLNIEFTYVS